MKQVALITGASSGIGRELAVIHASKGGDLVVVARSEEKLQTLKKELETTYRVSVYVLVKDLAQENAPIEIYQELQEQNIEVAYLINNAGFGGRGAFHQRDWKKERDMIQVNITALTNLCHLFIPDFIAKESGRILNVSSTASFLPGPFMAVYYATKAYVQSFSNALSEELRGTGVTVTNLMPGATNTGFAAQAGVKKTALFAKAFPPSDVALAGYKGMCTGKRDVLAGLRWSQRVLLQLVPLLPKSFVLKTVRDLQENEQ